MACACAGEDAPTTAAGTAALLETALLEAALHRDATLALGLGVRLTGRCHEKNSIHLYFYCCIRAWVGSRGDGTAGTGGGG
jgi:hypothetical protein